ncbi:hypothetical protein NA56DRAFT_244940 [Hyaloscypha hepaticicola]|uniref:Geranylgeranyl pyrophosphate synthetase n=1 Tax=Hyaloscypha hepaticicola TaxID=2082293 RepID=A0A2J6PWT8_9HELO|nr:hypothetical protein NA56DRAFT_244940 [Hyaloscypha hepaticicola]
MPTLTITSTTIAQISRLDLQDLNTPSLASITDVKHLSSYNWIEAPTPTIAVPGCPPLWSALKVPKRLQKDSSLIYITQNAARHPDSPLEPLFRALYIASPLYDIRSINIVTDRNNIRKLLSFINPGSTRNGLDTFTINIETTKNTTIFCREEATTHELIGPQEFRGYSHEFEKANTTNQISGSTGHHRIISYRFGDLSFIIRHKTDRYIKLDTNTIIPSPNSQERENDSLSNLLKSLSLSSSTNSPPTTTPAGSRLTIREEGQVVPLELTMELKTRVSHKPLQLREVVLQLWISQTPKLVRAYYTKSKFQVLEVKDIAVQVKRWEEGNQNNLRKLATLISKILQLVKGYNGHTTIKYNNKGDKLVIRKADGDTILPQDLYSKWDNMGNSEDTGTESTIKHVDGVETKEGSKM